MREELYDRRYESDVAESTLSFDSYKSALVALYQQILKFQAQSYCYYSRQGAFRFGLIRWDQLISEFREQENDGLDQIIDEIREKEKAFRRGGLNRFGGMSCMTRRAWRLRGAVKRLQRDGSLFVLTLPVCDRQSRRPSTKREPKRCSNGFVTMTLLLRTTPLATRMRRGQTNGLWRMTYNSRPGRRSPGHCYGSMAKVRL